MTRPSRWRLGGLTAAAVVLLLAGCAATPNQAPVQERLPATKKESGRKISANREPDWRPKTYTVKKGDTLYGIGLEFGYDYKEIAEWNNIENPNTILAGQVLKLAPTAESEHGAEQNGERKPQLVDYPKASKKAYTEQSAPENQNLGGPVKQESLSRRNSQDPRGAGDRKDQAVANIDDENLEWVWPSAGKLSGSFSEAGNGKGLDIAGKLGDPVHASAAGKVVYSGSGLRGYGKLIIIKHNKNYLSAYAHNSQLLVKEGELVAKGQKIAEMGNTDANQVKLHFEIRRLGKPVDPMKFLPSDRTS